MDLSELISFAKEYGIMPQFMNMDEVKSLMHGHHEVSWLMEFYTAFMLDRRMRTSHH